MTNELLPRGGHGILIIDDERSLRFTIGEALRGEGFRVFEAPGGESGLLVLREEEIDLVLLDQKLKESGEDGLEILKLIKREWPDTEVVMMTAFGRFESAVQATKLGCYQYLGKPFEIDQLVLILRGALENRSLRREVEVLKRAESGRYSLELIEGASPAMRRTLDELDKIAAGSTTALLLGETGAGKELLARRIHEKSPLAAGPFVEVNCSAIPENLLESELFGFEKGAFTDARARKKGLFELADGGTIFLDEIGEMSLGLQSKLLRVLETKSFKRVGGTTNVVVNVRFVAATNRDLKKAVAEGHFREDLYYRLSVVPISIPPLRDRVDDIPSLIDHFIQHFNRELRRNVTGADERAMTLLTGYHWPGNVRELRNVIERALLLGSGTMIEAGSLPTEMLARAATASTGSPDAAGLAALPAGPAGVLTLAAAERYAVVSALARFEGNKTRASEALGISRQTLRQKMKDYGLAE
ncbi:MAG: sigma-54 dependent transcriptional regulator [Candidatus Eisenbacteria bacterium]|nr:sigma-54 dependent transcriptional regulator [Candidatus Eisenbacteria bacterium]